MSGAIVVSALVGTGLGAIALWLVYATLNGRPFPMVSNDRQAFVALGILGFVMCASAFPRTSAGTWSWTSVYAILSAVLGVAALALIALTLLNRPVPFVSGLRGSMVALAGIMAVKWVVATVQMFAAR